MRVQTVFLGDNIVKRRIRLYLSGVGIRRNFQFLKCYFWGRDVIMLMGFGKGQREMSWDMQGQRQISERVGWWRRLVLGRGLVQNGEDDVIINLFCVFICVYFFDDVMVQILDCLQLNLFVSCSLIFKFIGLLYGVYLGGVFIRIFF